MTVKNYSKESIRLHRFNTLQFIAWERRGLTKPSEVTHPTLERFSRYLFYYRKANGDPLATSSQETRLSTLRSFFGWLTKQPPAFESRQRPGATAPGEAATPGAYRLRGGDRAQPAQRQH